VYRLTSDERTIRLAKDVETGEREDGEILESELEVFISSVLEEIQWREENIGEAYPFKLQRRSGSTIGGAWDLFGPKDPTDPHVVVYIACLLIVAFRRNLLESTEHQKELFTNHRIGIIFQICACLALGGYLSGEVVSFGWPRAKGEAFLPALREAWARFGAYDIVTSAPLGAPTSIKDGGIDIIAWRNFTDGRPSRLIIFGQVASGDNWMEKSAREPADLLLGSWFNGLRPKFYLPATIMPFDVHEELGSEARSIKAVHGAMQYREIAHGLIFDRSRVASAAKDAIQSATLPSRNDGVARFDELRQWVSDIISGSTGPVEKGQAA
jgi:hypothetical protein